MFLSCNFFVWKDRAFFVWACGMHVNMFFMSLSSTMGLDKEGFLEMMLRMLVKKAVTSEIFSRLKSSLSAQETKRDSIRAATL